MYGHDVPGDDGVEVLLAGPFFRQVRGQVPAHFDVRARVFVVVVVITELFLVLLLLLVIVAALRRLLAFPRFF